MHSKIWNVEKSLSVWKKNPLETDLVRPLDPITIPSYLIGADQSSHLGACQTVSHHEAIKLQNVKTRLLVRCREGREKKEGIKACIKGELLCHGGKTAYVKVFLNHGCRKQKLNSLLPAVCSSAWGTQKDKARLCRGGSKCLTTKSKSRIF